MILFCNGECLIIYFNRKDRKDLRIKVAKKKLSIDFACFAPSLRTLRLIDFFLFDVLYYSSNLNVFKISAAYT